MFEPIYAELQDDALHKKRIFGKIETFYYDAVLNDGYSIVVLINIINLGVFSRVLTGFFLYRNTELLHADRRKWPLRKLQGSLKHPSISICNRKIIDTIDSHKEKPAYYTITMGTENYGVHLNFEPKTCTWKGSTFLGKWLAIPSFSVIGTIYNKKKSVAVKGHGYHDHNIYPIYAPLFTQGYDWGKIPIGDITITWAYVIKNKKKIQKILVINMEGSYISIASKDIEIDLLDMKRYKNKIVPTSWRIRVDNDILKLNLTLNSINAHHIRIPSVNFWRHHIQYSGTMKFKNEPIENVNSIEMIDSLRFI